MDRREQTGACILLTAKETAATGQGGTAANGRAKNKKGTSPAGGLAHGRRPCGKSLFYKFEKQVYKFTVKQKSVFTYNVKSQ